MKKSFNGINLEWPHYRGSKKNEHLQAFRPIYKHKVTIKFLLWGFKSVIGHTFYIALL